MDIDFVYDLKGQLIGEYVNGALERVYLYSMGMPLAQIDASVLAYLHFDHLGSPRFATNSNGQASWVWNSDPFGVLLPNEDVDGDGTPIRIYLRLPGQYFDQESSLHYNFYLSLEPNTGRYTQSDPIRMHGGYNRYLYVLADPINSYDPYGLKGLRAPGKAIRDTVHLDTTGP